MSDLSSHGLMRLHKGALQRLSRRRREGVAVFEGLLWLTEDGAITDTMLAAGQSHVFPRGDAVLVQAMADTTFLRFRADDADGAAWARPGRDFDAAGVPWFVGVRGRPVLARPIAPADTDALARFVKALSPLSRQRRFHLPLAEASPDLLELLARFDSATGFALAVTPLDEGSPRIVAEARYAADLSGKPAQREVALAVADDWQRQGLGRRLLRALSRHALQHGVSRLFGDVLRDNKPMLELAAQEGFAIRAHPEDRRLVRVARTLA